MHGGVDTGSYTPFELIKTLCALVFARNLQPDKYIDFFDGKHVIHVPDSIESNHQTQLKEVYTSLEHSDIFKFISKYFEEMRFVDSSLQYENSILSIDNRQDDIITDILFYVNYMQPSDGHLVEYGNLAFMMNLPVSRYLKSIDFSSLILN